MICPSKCTRILAIFLVFITMESCKQKQEIENVIYTEEELGVYIQWPYIGYSIVSNDLAENVTLKVSFANQIHEDILTTIGMGQSVRFKNESFSQAVFESCSRVSIVLADGTEIQCTNGATNAWSKSFFENVEEIDDIEIVEIEKKKIYHNLCNLVYHIDQELIHKWSSQHDNVPSLEDGGDWPAIILDYSQIDVEVCGGEFTITVLNYPTWWIIVGYDEHDPSAVIYPTSSDGDTAYTFDLLDGGWYHAKVPQKGQSNQLVISVDENHSGQSRSAIIEMEAGDVFSSVAIHQN